ncbi:hypothetical protein Dimus_030021 [Dionaea muscipula]
MVTAPARIFTFLSTPFLLRLASRHSSSLLLLHTSRVSLLPSPISFLPRSSSSSSSSLNPSKHLHSLATDQFHDSSGSSSLSPSPTSHPWPEWSKFLDRLHADGYFSNRRFNVALYEFVSVDALPDDFLRAANACMAFARDNASILCSLSRKDIEAVVENGLPFLFRNAVDSKRRMMYFLNGCVNSVPEYDKPSTVDLMKFLLSYASTAIVSPTMQHNREFIQSSVRYLFVDLAGISGTSQGSLVSGSVTTNSPGTYGQTTPFGQNIQMKRGDWICQRCRFMNFARKMNCLECNEPRPKGQLTGGEWECPQCDFFNYGRNLVCLRCDCKKPNVDSLNRVPVRGLGYTMHSKNSEADNRVVENQDKAQQWFSKISKLENTSDTYTSNASANEEFPEISPLRKGINRFAVSTRKTPLETKLADEQYRRSMGTPMSNDSHGGDKSLHEKINQELNEMLGHRSSFSHTNNNSSGFGKNTGNEASFPTSRSSWQHGNPSNASHVPSSRFTEQIVGDKAHFPNTLGVENTPVQMDEKEREQAAKSERWQKKADELYDVKHLPGAVSNVDFLEGVPMPEGENHLVSSKPKDHFSNSPVYRRLMTMEHQATREGEVPFVPFPPGYFAQDMQRQTSDSTNKSVVQTSPTPKASEPTGLSSSIHGVPLEEHHPAGAMSPYPTHAEVDSRRAVIGGRSSPSSGNGSSQPSENLSITHPWKGRSLEGSAVKEPDPLDMSEEAKAERWFKRVAQIKDISELSEIPDEDFPSIMPMRKGVNRFVVSKRKTPVERRLTSSPYRRDLPVVNSDPLKKESETS